MRSKLFGICCSQLISKRDTPVSTVSVSIPKAVVVADTVAEVAENEEAAEVAAVEAEEEEDVEVANPVTMK
jgi:hypothetical protein